MCKDTIFSPSDPEYWDELYKGNDTAWDIGAPTPIFDNWAKSLKRKYSICVLGAGNGWDALNLSQKGHDVTAIDFSITAVNNIKKLAKSLHIPVNVDCIDIFKMQNKYLYKFDIVLEYTCFCAILPEKRNDYIQVVYNIIKKGGKFVAIFFPINKNINEGGPPFGVNVDLTIIKFSPFFSVYKNEFSNLSIKPRFNNEKFIILKKNEN